MLVSHLQVCVKKLVSGAAVGTSACDVKMHSVLSKRPHDRHPSVDQSSYQAHVVVVSSIELRHKLENKKTVFIDVPG